MSKSAPSDFDAYCPELIRAQDRIAEFKRGNVLGLVLAGNTGTGKTTLARSVLRYLMVDVKYISEDVLLDTIRATYGPGPSNAQDVIAPLRDVKALILDDVGVGYVKDDSLEWLQGIYWQLLDRRYEKKLPVLMTTNLPLPQLMVRLGSRAASRLTAHLLHKTEYTEHLIDNANYVDMFKVADYRLRGWGKAK